MVHAFVPIRRQEATTGPPTRIAAVIARYARPEMSRVWAEESKLETWLAVELAVLDAWAEVGTVPRALALADVDRHELAARVRTGAPGARGAPPTPPAGAA